MLARRWHGSTLTLWGHLVPWGLPMGAELWCREKAGALGLCQCVQRPVAMTTQVEHE